ncbi:MAG: 50S ribosomal protein L4 [Bacteroidetes bacterium]|nr:MAG: 50S ribosomal protein L4 [Bacteroidota bacterium]
MEVAVLSQSGQSTGRTVQFNEAIFGIEPNDHAIYLDVKQYHANQRQGTHKAKERAEVSYSTKKIKKQKGTGGARAGSIKSPLFVGGGRAFGPRPRDYRFKLNKKLKQLARKSALSYKAKEKSLMVVEDFNYEAPRTKQYIAFLNQLALTNTKTLLVLPENKDNVYLSSRNIPKTNVITFNQLNTFNILNADKIVFMESAVNKLETLLSKSE